MTNKPLKTRVLSHTPQPDGTVLVTYGILSRRGYSIQMPWPADVAAKEFPIGAIITIGPQTS